VFQQGEIDSIGDRVSLTQDPGDFARLPVDDARQDQVQVSAALAAQAKRRLAREQVLESSDPVRSDFERDFGRAAHRRSFSAGSFLTFPPNTVFELRRRFMPNCTACNASPARSSPEYLAVGDGDFNGAFHMLQTLDLAEIEFPFTGARLGPPFAARGSRLNFSSGYATPANAL